jgi:serine/threonine protein kinase
MTTPISIEDVKREVKILRALSGHENLVEFYDACEDDQNVYIVMEYVTYHFILEDILICKAKLLKWKITTSL